MWLLLVGSQLWLLQLVLLLCQLSSPNRCLVACVACVVIDVFGSVGSYGSSTSCGNMTSLFLLGSDCPPMDTWQRCRQCNWFLRKGVANFPWPANQFGPSACKRLAGISPVAFPLFLVSGHGALALARHLPRPRKGGARRCEPL